MIWTKLYYFGRYGSIFGMIWLRINKPWGFGVLRLLVIYRFALATSQGQRCLNNNTVTLTCGCKSCLYHSPFFSIFSVF